MKQGIIYKATNKKSGKSYVGKTIESLSTRIYKHYSAAKKHSHHFANALNKYDKKDWEWSILAEMPHKYLSEIEQLWIAGLNTYHNGYNSTLGGEGQVGFKHTEESKAKMSKAISGKNHPNYGKKLSEETCKKMSISSAGKKLSIKTRKKISEVQKGKKLSKETKRRISEAHKGKKHTKEHIDNAADGKSLYWKIIKPNGHTEIIKNLSKYCRENNLSHGHMGAVARGERKQHKCFKCERVENNGI